MYDKIYYINLDKRKDRLAEFQRDVIEGLELDKTKIKRIPAIDTTGFNINEAGIIGCPLSHLKAWKDIIDNQYSSAIVFEDDYLPLTDAADFHSAMEELYTCHDATRCGPAGFGVCCLAWSLDGHSIRSQRSPRFWFANDIATCAGYIITLEYAKLMYSKIETSVINMLMGLEMDPNNPGGLKVNDQIYIDNALDHAWKEFQNHTWLISYPRIGKQREGYSDIWNNEIKNNDW